MPFYDTQDYSKTVNGMKIIPLQTSELKKIVTNGKTDPLADLLGRRTHRPHDESQIIIDRLFLDQPEILEDWAF